ncbi:MAG: hypothetical protein ACK5MW_08285 [Enterococcus sp.]
MHVQSWKSVMNLPLAIEGYGNIHHAAFRVADEKVLAYWIKRINEAGLPNSGFTQL